MQALLQRSNVLDIDPADFERCWWEGCFGGFLVERAAAPDYPPLWRNRNAPWQRWLRNLAVPKFGLRALAQSMARELAAQGVHVGFVIIDGQIESERYQHLAGERGQDSLLQPDAVAETYVQLHRQPRSAWTHEIDVRP